MIEYLYDAARMVAGQEAAMSAVIVDDNDVQITENCRLVLHFEEDEMYIVPGIYLPDEEQWTFTIPAEATTGRNGRYEYCLQHDGLNLCFKKPIYILP